MTNLPPDPQSSPKTPLGFDEFVGIFIALGAIGAILFWSLSRSNQGFQLPNLLSSSPSATAPLILSPTPEATASPDPETEIAPTVIPTQPPELATPQPYRNPFERRSQVPAIIPLPAPAPVAPSPSPSTSPRQVNFLDVPGDFWASPFITVLAGRGIVNGFPGGYFKPTDPVTRAEFAALLQEAFDQNPGQRTITKFQDLPPNFWAVPAIDRAIQTGFLRGYPDNTFRPQQEIPRVEVLVALASGLNLAPPSIPPQVLQSFYQDAAEIPNYATEKLAATTTSGLVVNYPDAKLLRPNQSATRAEVAAMIHQALVQAGKLEPIQSPYVVTADRK